MKFQDGISKQNVVSKVGETLFDALSAGPKPEILKTTPEKVI
jgi:hypothetical protein